MTPPDSLHPLPQIVHDTLMVNHGQGPVLMDHSNDSVFEYLAPIFVSGFFFLTLVTVIRMFTDTITKRRLIERGLVDDNAKSILNQSTNDPWPNLKWGMVLVAIGSAILIGTRIQNEQVTSGFIMIFGGLAFILYFLLARNQKS